MARFALVSVLFFLGTLVARVVSQLPSDYTEIGSVEEFRRFAETFKSGAIDNCTNTGDITNTNGVWNQTYLGGIVGEVHCKESFVGALLSINNTVNRGTLSASNGTVCGFVCQNKYGDIPGVQVCNSINRGSIEGRDAFGVTSVTPSSLNNVVNLGTVSGTTSSNCLFPQSMIAPSTFVLDGACSKSGLYTRAFKHNSSDGLYHTVGTKEDVQRLLNKVVMDEPFRMAWTSDLELVAPFTVTVSGVIVNKTLIAVPGARLSTLPRLDQYFNTSYVVTDTSTSTVCNADTVVMGDMNVTVAAASIIEIVIDGSSGSDKDQVKKDVEDGLKDLGFVIGDVTVREDDGVLIVSVIVADQDTDSIAGSLHDCIPSFSSV